MKVLITGITGFAGSHLAEYLLSRGDVEIYGTYRTRSRMDHIAHIA
ncbi:NAD-dependent epimerase/dehydratase family protein, partial [Mesorhizobium sp. M00.F.Ca.ET.186.01.1.1]